ncbi:MAG TPA: NYN domain-containing protein [Oligoflexia bacterium]|nr:NYN domain-containing protein [Oligoflexia bacterium]HMP47857.1 NYN domain-containing protein [Oligoflexia bacterium]
MGREELEIVRKGIVKRKTKRRVGLFIDATGLDRATRRLERKIDLSRLVSGLSSGLQIEVARYYTLIPFEDDARQLAFLDAVERAGVEVVTKRLPPKGVKRQVSMDVHMASDILNFAHGAFEAQKDSSINSSELSLQEPMRVNEGSSIISAPTLVSSPREKTPIKRIAVVVCASRELSYALYTAYEQGVETVLADFGHYGTSDGWKGVDRWVDLSTSETIWRE